MRFLKAPSPTLHLVSRFVGVRPDIFVGQDLSFPAVGTTTRTVPMETPKSCTTKSRNAGNCKATAKTSPIPSKERKPTCSRGRWFVATTARMPTSLDFAKYRTWLEHTAAQTNGQCALFNCTEGGAFIAGMDHKPLAEVLATYPTEA